MCGSLSNYVINVNKPSGMSSNTLVTKVKHILGVKKAGHLGTLDPLGTGVLPVTINSATRLFDYSLFKTKTYRAVFKFGVETDTLDSEGTIVKKDENCDISIDKINSCLKKFIGKIEQMPPNFSSKKINGKKAYELARENVQFKLKPKLVEIYKIAVLKQLKKNVFLFEIDCGEGTYIRSLCRDIANECTTCGTMVAICRTRCGICDISNSYTLKDIESGKFEKISINSFLVNFKKYEINKSYYQDLCDGKNVYFEKNLSEFLLYCDDELFGVYTTNEEGLLKKITNFKS